MSYYENDIKKEITLKWKPLIRFNPNTSLLFEINFKQPITDNISTLILKGFMSSKAGVKQINPIIDVKQKKIVGWEEK